MRLGQARSRDFGTRFGGLLPFPAAGRIAAIYPRAAGCIFQGLPLLPSMLPILPRFIITRVFIPEKIKPPEKGL